MIRMTNAAPRGRKALWSAAAAILTLSAFSPVSAQVLNIIGGHPAQAGDAIASSTVLIVGELAPAKAGGQPQQYICTGSLLAADIVVTAAHCVAEDINNPVNAANMRLVFGLAVTPTTTTLPPLRTPTGYVYNPGWQGAVNGAESGSDTHDIAILHFDGGLPAGYAPATLLPASDPITAGMTVTLAGYGVSNGVKDTGAGTLRIVNNVPVEQTLGRTEVVMNQTGGVGSCSGDSGGPAFLNVNGQELLWGVTSRGDKTCAQVGIYTRISPYMNFINSAEQTLRSQDGSLQFASAKSEPALETQRLAASRALSVAPKTSAFAE